MPGKKITDHQVMKYKEHRNLMTQTAAAAKTAISERSARRIERSEALPSQGSPRGCRSRLTRASSAQGIAVRLAATDAGVQRFARRRAGRAQRERGHHAARRQAMRVGDALREGRHGHGVSALRGGHDGQFHEGAAADQAVDVAALDGGAVWWWTFMAGRRRAWCGGVWA